MVVAVEVIDPNLALIAPLVLTLLVTALTLGSQLRTSQRARDEEKSRWLREKQSTTYVALVEFMYKDEAQRKPDELARAYAGVKVYGSQSVVAVLDAWWDDKTTQVGDSKWDAILREINSDLGVK